MPFKISVKLIA